MVAVRDQELPVGEGLLDPVGRETPEACALHLDVGLAVGPPRPWLALVEEEERLELGVDPAPEGQAPLLRPAGRPLVRQGHAPPVGGGPERGGPPPARAPAPP